MSDPMAHLRADVMARPDIERLEYMLDILAYYLDPVPAFYQGCADLALGLSNAEMRMLHALDAKRGKYLTINNLAAARCLDRPHDEWCTDDKVISAISVIRSRLRKMALPVEIVTWRGVGYTLEAPDGFRFETAAEILRAERLAA